MAGFRATLSVPNTSRHTLKTTKNHEQESICIGLLRYAPLGTCGILQGGIDTRRPLCRYRFRRHHTRTQGPQDNQYRAGTSLPKRLLFVYPKTTSDEALVVFIEGKKSNKKGGLKILPPLYVYNNENKYTSEILKIFNYKEDNHA